MKEFENLGVELQLGSEWRCLKFRADGTQGNEIGTKRTTIKPAGLNHKKPKPAVHVVYLVGTYISLYIEIGDISFLPLVSTTITWKKEINHGIKQPTNLLVSPFRGNITTRFSFIARLVR